MNIYDKKIEKITKKYKLQKFILPNFCPYSILRIRIRIFLRTFFNEIRMKENTVIICDDLVEQYLKRRKIQLQIVNCERHLHDGTEAFEDYLCNEIAELETKQVYSIFSYKNSIYALCMIYSFSISVQIIDMYEAMLLKGINTCGTNGICSSFQKNFLYDDILTQGLFYYAAHFKILRILIHDVTKKDKGVLWLLEPFCVRKSYIEEKNRMVKKLKLKHHVATLIEIRDFSSLFKLRSELCQDEPWIECLCRDLEKVLDAIKIKILKRKDNAIVWNWVDAVSYYKLKDMKWLDLEKQNCINFSNCFTMMPYTTWTLRTLFSGKHVIRDKMFLFDKIQNNEQYPLYQQLCKMGYSIFYLGLMRMWGKVIDCPRIDRGCRRASSYYSCEKQWKALVLLATEKRKPFILIHNLFESHDPYINPFLDRLESPEYVTGVEWPEEQKVKSREYLDAELEWYSKYYGNSTVIYMSDHGDHGAEKNHYSEERIHTIFMIRKNGCTSIQNESMISVKDEINILVNVLNGSRYNDYFRKRICIESYDSYSKSQVDDVLKDISKRSKGEYMQFQAIRTDNEKYILFSDGSHILFHLPDEETDYSDDAHNQDKINEMRNELTPYFVNIDQYDFFKYSRKLHKK